MQYTEYHSSAVRCTSYLAEVSNICEQDGGLHDALVAGARSLKDAAHVLQHLSSRLAA
jgi:hypothetical protein